MEFIDNGHQNFPSQSEFGLESASCKIIFLFPNQTGIGLENLTHFLGVSFPNQTWFGLEKYTEWNVAALTMNIASIIEDCEMHFWMAGEKFCGQIVHSNCVCGHLLTVQFSTSFKPERLWDPRNWLLAGFDQIVISPYCMYVPVFALKLVCVCIC